MPRNMAPTENDNNSAVSRFSKEVLLHESIRMMKRTVMAGLFALVCGLYACKDGCVTCSGITAPQEICKDDFNEASDYQNYVNEYEENGGTCEE